MMGALRRWRRNLADAAYRSELRRQRERDRVAAERTAERERERREEPREQRCKCGYLVLVGEKECPRCERPVEEA